LIKSVHLITEQIGNKNQTEPADRSWWQIEGRNRR